MAADSTADGNEQQRAAYLECLQSQRHLSPNTIVSYARDLTELASLMMVDDITPPFIAVTHVQIRRFASQLHARGIDARSMARKLSASREGWHSGRIDRLADALRVVELEIGAAKARASMGSPIQQ